MNTIETSTDLKSFLGGLITRYDRGQKPGTNRLVERNTSTTTMSTKRRRTRTTLTNETVKPKSKNSGYDPERVRKSRKLMGKKDINISGAGHSKLIDPSASEDRAGGTYNPARARAAREKRKNNDNQTLISKPKMIVKWSELVGLKILNF